jgi:cyclopropane fatty-acyl-phospholipid synthase-like methyltransferase
MFAFPARSYFKTPAFQKVARAVNMTPGRMKRNNRRWLAVWALWKAKLEEGMEVLDLSSNAFVARYCRDNGISLATTELPPEDITGEFDVVFCLGSLNDVSEADRMDYLSDAVSLLSEDGLLVLYAMPSDELFDLLETVPGTKLKRAGSYKSIPYPDNANIILFNQAAEFGALLEKD